MIDPLQIQQKRSQETILDRGDRTLLYRNVFGSAEGRLVLADLLRTSHFYHPAENDRQAGAQDVARQVLLDCGVWDNSRAVVDKLMDIAPQTNEG